MLMQVAAITSRIKVGTRHSTQATSQSGDGAGAAFWVPPVCVAFILTHSFRIAAAADPIEHWFTIFGLL
jgi:hypothetical protein